MCKCTSHKQDPSKHHEKKFRLAEYFIKLFNEYAKDPKEYIRPEQYKAANAIMVCRTAALGVDVYACPHCGEVSEVFHSCNNRFCPTCSWRDTVKWAEKVKNEMLDLPHRHVIMTLPHELIPLIKNNGKHLLNILLRTSADTFKDWISNKYGLNIGVVAVLHTYGEKKNLHYHVHMIVSWGGINSSGELKAIKGKYVDYEFLKNKFRCKFEDALVARYHTGHLESNFKDEIDIKRFIKRINNKQWVIHLEPPMDVPSLVIRYIGRYSKRACLSEYKITAMEGDYISFRYKEYKLMGKSKEPIERELTLHYRDFFPRLLQHVPLPYFRIVRYYGLYSNRGRIPKEYLFKETQEEAKAKDPVEDYEDIDPQLCTNCGVKKEYQYTYVEKKSFDGSGKPLVFIYKRPQFLFREAA